MTMHRTRPDLATLRGFFDDLAGRWDHIVPDPAGSSFAREWLASLPIPPAARVLEIGCGTGRLLKLLAPLVAVQRGTIDAIDLSPTMLAHARRTVVGLPDAPAISFHEADAASLPFPDASFPLVVIANTFPHLRPADAILRECARVLAPGGVLDIVHFAGRGHINEIHARNPVTAADILQPATAVSATAGSVGFEVVRSTDAAGHYWIRLRRPGTVAAPAPPRESSAQH